MIIQESLFVGRRIYLAPLDPENDAELEARWTHDIEYLRSIRRRSSAAGVAGPH